MTVKEFAKQYLKVDISCSSIIYIIIAALPLEALFEVGVGGPSQDLKLYCFVTKTHTHLDNLLLLNKD